MKHLTIFENFSNENEEIKDKIEKLKVMINNQFFDYFNTDDLLPSKNKIDMIKNWMNEIKELEKKIKELEKKIK
jgi:hypothetical protein